MAMPARPWDDLKCPQCGRLLFKVRGATLPGLPGKGMTWAGGPEVQIKCRCRALVEVGADRPPKVIVTE